MLNYSQAEFNSKQDVNCGTFFFLKKEKGGGRGGSVHAVRVLQIPFFPPVPQFKKHKANVGTVAGQEQVENSNAGLI